MARTGGLPLFVALTSVLDAAGLGLRALDGGSGCAALSNRGTHFTIDVTVGTPGQTFSVVADTGSNSLIVPSCVCQQQGKCDSSDRCFSGTNKSSSFHLELSEDKEPISLVLSFGSGQIQAVVAQEQVRVGDVDVSLKDGLLLMTDRALKISGAFEGILGLGLPQPGTNWTAVEEQEKQQPTGQGGDMQGIIQKILGGTVSEDDIKKILGQGGGGNAGEAPATEIPDQAMRKSQQGALGKGNGTKGNGAKGNGTRAGRKPVHRDSPTGFLEQAGIGRFSMCFNDGANGVLRIGEPPLEESHGGMGTAHWGLDFRGISVGDHHADVLFCDGKNMTKDQASPCGAIPDSGTTMLMGPQDQIGALMEGICDKWPRCSKNYTKLIEAEEAAGKAMMSKWGLNPFNMNSLGKTDVLQLLLMDCESWMTKDGGLDSDMPDLHFHVRGTNGTKQALKIPAHMYIMEAAPEHAESALKLLEGIGSIPIDPNATKGSKKVCTPAFGAMDYNTKTNGPVWILGTPIFYEYVVGYDMNTKPPAISFAAQSKQGCGSCGGQVELAAHGPRRRGGVDEAIRSPRRISGPPRVPNIDATKPL